MLIVLVGPKGSGKSHIGRALERRLGVSFFHVEPLWMEYHARCKAEGRAPVISEGIGVVHPAVSDAVQRHGKVCIETTGASTEILEGLTALAPPEARCIVRVRVPLELCLERIARRDPTHQIPMDEVSIRKVYDLSLQAGVDPDLVLDNIDLSEDEIVTAFRPLIEGAPGR